MRAQDNRRYRQAAADYLHRPFDDPAVIQLAWEAAKAAELVAFEVLRAGARRQPANIPSNSVLSKG
ncbi:MAG: hypothetical protein M0Z36_09945 [Thermaerobacter sp.]|nr:hypothetical protein [Thermaerobacter sp.]